MLILRLLNFKTVLQISGNSKKSPTARKNRKTAWKNKDEECVKLLLQVKPTLQ